MPTAPSLRRSHFGRDFEGGLAAAVSRRWRPSFHRDHHWNHGLWHVNLALCVEARESIAVQGFLALAAALVRRQLGAETRLHQLSPGGRKRKADSWRQR